MILFNLLIIRNFVHISLFKMLDSFLHVDFWIDFKHVPMVNTSLISFLAVMRWVILMIVNQTDDTHGDATLIIEMCPLHIVSGLFNNE